MRGRQRRPLLPHRLRLWPQLHMLGRGWRGCVPCRGGLPGAPPPSSRAQGLGIHGWQGGNYSPTMQSRKLRLRESRDRPPGSQTPSRGLGHREDTRWDPRFRPRVASLRQPRAPRVGWRVAERKGWWVSQQATWPNTPRCLTPSCPGSSGGETEAQRAQALCPAAHLTRDRSRS